MQWYINYMGKCSTLYCSYVFLNIGGGPCSRSLRFQGLHPNQWDSTCYSAAPSRCPCSLHPFRPAEVRAPPVGRSEARPDVGSNRKWWNYGNWVHGWPCWWHARLSADKAGRSPESCDWLHVQSEKESPRFQVDLLTYLLLLSLILLFIDFIIVFVDVSILRIK